MGDGLVWLRFCDCLHRKIRLTELELSLVGCGNYQMLHRTVLGIILILLLCVQDLRVQDPSLFAGLTK